MEFVEGIEAQGVELERRKMTGDEDSPAIAPMVVEVDRDDPKKPLDDLDIPIPKLSRRLNRNYKRLEDLDVSALGNKKIPYKSYTEEQLREIVFREVTTGDVSHVTQLPTDGVIDATQAIGWFTMKIMGDLRLVSGYDVLYGHIKAFVRDYLFEQAVALEDRVTMRNLSEGDATRETLECFKRGVNALTVEDSGSAQIIDTIRLRDTRAFPVNEQEYVVSRKCLFNRIVGDSHLELRFASYLDECEDVVAFAKL